MECQHDAKNHSSDIVEVWTGHSAPVYLCGYHLFDLGVLTWRP